MFHVAQQAPNQAHAGGAACLGVGMGLREPRILFGMLSQHCQSVLEGGLAHHCLYCGLLCHDLACGQVCALQAIQNTAHHVLGVALPIGGNKGLQGGSAAVRRARRGGDIAEQGIAAIEARTG